MPVAHNLVPENELRHRVLDLLQRSLKRVSQNVVVFCLEPVKVSLFECLPRRDRGPERTFKEVNGINSGSEILGAV
jgi:hypothetical protein